MIRFFRVLLIFVVFALPTGAQVTATAPLQTQTAAVKTDPRVLTVQFESKLTGKTLPYHVLLPKLYDDPTAKEKRYPVLYLLHGLGGHYNNWFERTKLADHAAAFNLIVVTPEGNDNWYSDSATVPTDKYESYIVQELIPDVERRYRAMGSREGRAIGGLSMGGYGALKFGVKYPQMFAFAGSMSGALDAASWKESDLAGLRWIWKTLQPVFGPDGGPNRTANDLKKLFQDIPAEKIAGLPTIYFDCGTEDPLFPTNRAFSELLLAKKIPHEYRQLPGTHSWTYWNSQVQEILKLSAKKMNAATH